MHYNNLSKLDHLDQVNMTYIQHMCGALKFSLISAIACIIFFIHAFFPNYLIYDGSFLIYNLNNELINTKKNINVD